MTSVHLPVIEVFAYSKFQHPTFREPQLQYHNTLDHRKLQVINTHPIILVEKKCRTDVTSELKAKLCLRTDTPELDGCVSTITFWCKKKNYEIKYLHQIVL